VARSDKRRREKRKKKDPPVKSGFILTPSSSDPTTDATPALLRPANIAVELYLRPMPRA
jgi:hypothetical protein